MSHTHSHSIKEYPLQAIGIAALGAAAGAITALVMAPKKGSDTRAELKKHSLKLRQTMHRKQKEAESTAKTMASDAKSAAVNTKSAVQSTAKKVKNDTATTVKDSTDTQKPKSAPKDEIDHIRRNGEP